MGLQKQPSEHASAAPTVSFIMGVYNCRDGLALRESIESIINQTYSDWELIIVDDGSDDGGCTTKAIEDAAITDPRIVPLRYERNQGLAFALNYCLGHARGRYIARQDDDDISEPKRLEAELSYLEEHQNVSIVGTNAALFDEGGIWGALIRPEDPDRRSFLWNSPFIHPSVVMRADALRAVGGYRVSPDTLLLEDYDLFMRMYAAGVVGHNIQTSFYRYRSDRRTSKPRGMNARIREAKIRAQGFKSLGLGISGFPYIAKPIVLGILPKGLYGVIQGKRTAS